MGRVILMLAVFSCMTACTSRVVYEEPISVSAAPNAININTASIDELEKLPYVGRKTAEAIVQFRNDNGRFRKPEYLMQIRGISESRFREIRGLIRTE